MSTNFLIFFVFAALTVSTSSGQQRGQQSTQQLQQCNEPNQEYVSCGMPCPDTCANRYKWPRICLAMCYIGCQCKRGYVRKGQDEKGPCILPSQCT